jgi:hypothetical protein
MDEAQLQPLIEKSVAEPLAELSDGAGPATIISQPGIFDFSKCVSDSQLKGQNTLTVQVGMEVCASDGRLLATVNSIDRGGMSFIVPESGRQWCYLNKQCQLPWERGKTYIWERISEDGDGTAALLRLGD